MKHLAFLIILINIIGCSNNQQTENLNSYLTDRIWMTEYKQQYYYSSKDNKQYLWMTFERRNGGTYTPFSNAKGNPETNMLQMNVKKYREGWYYSSDYKIIGDSLILQDKDDIDAQNLTTTSLEILKDTIIGVFEYNTLLDGRTILRSKKR